MQTRHCLTIANVIGKVLGLPADPAGLDRIRRLRSQRFDSVEEFAAGIVHACRQGGSLVVARPATAERVGELLRAGVAPFVLVRRGPAGFEALVVAAIAEDRVTAVMVREDLDEHPVKLHVRDLAAMVPSATLLEVSGVVQAGPGAWESDEAHPNPLSRLWRLLRHERRLVISIYVYAVLAGLFSLTLPLGVQAIIGLVSGGLILQPVVLLIAFVVVGTLATGGLQLLQLGVVETVQQRVFARLAFELTSRLNHVRLDRVTGTDLPELMNRFFEIKTIQKSLAKLLMDWVTAGLQVLFGLVLLTFYHPYFALFGIGLLGVLALIFYFTAPQGWETNLGESKYKYRVAHWLEEVAFASRTFRFAGQATLPVDRMDREVAGYLGYRAAHFRVLVRQSASFVAFKTLITAGLLILGSVLVVNRQITLGQFVASEIVIVTVLLAVEKLIFGLSDVYDILTALEKAGHAANLPMESLHGVGLPPRVAHGGATIELRQVSFQYDDANQPTLQGLSLALAPGERVAVTGPHGSGVSTLLSVVSGLYPGFQGAVTVDGVSWRDLDPLRARATIAFCGQNAELFEGTIEENIGLGRTEVRTEQVLEALAHVGLAGWLAEQPDGLQTGLRVEGRQLARNIVTRLQLARAIAGGPRLLVVDRVLDPLDPADRTALLQVLLDPAAPWTCLLASQAYDVLSSLDRLVVMREGRVVADGAPAAVIAQDPWCRQLPPAS